MLPDAPNAPSPAERRIGHVSALLDAQGCATAIRLAGRVLYLTADAARLRRQLAGHPLDSAPAIEELYGHVSTDAIIKANPDCYYYDERLGRLVLRSLGNGGYVEPGEIADGGFGLLMAGEGWGEGSSREVAALALRLAGIGAVYAPSIAPIHRQNLINNGMFPITDEALARRLAAGDTVPVAELADGLDTLSVRILLRGGLFAFMLAREAGQEPDAPVPTPPRPMTLAEKIIAAHMSTQHGAVRPGDHGFLRVDAAFSHDYTTAPAAAAAETALSRPVQVRQPQAMHCFPDHLSLAHAQPGVSAEALAGIADLRQAQQTLAARTGMHWHADPSGSADGICHTVVRERIALPGQVVLGTDSHTCSAGALNCLAYGIGNSEIAAVWEWNCVSARVPATVRVELLGALRPSCTAKDVMLHLARLGKASGLFTGRVIEFGGAGLASLAFDEQAVLTNMAVECNALTAICEPTPAMLDYLARQRGLTHPAIQALCVQPDADAVYEQRLALDLADVETLVALPGHPGNGVALDQVRGTPIDLAYGGSCTAGDLGSIAMYAEVLAGRSVSVPTYVQYGSRDVMQAAQRLGLHQVLAAAGVTVITEPGCGACVNAGPGGPRRGQAAISATNRNMPGRMGDGDAYLANPKVVAASAVMGCIAGPEQLPHRPVSEPVPLSH
ncbi:MAG: 3-isopropylmalate dehydratase [Burkholderiales bacterium]|nr:3-isopropylmalate dehydratase [Burkholderiales bacterium]